MSFDEQPDGDPHGECAAEIHRLQAELAALRALSQPPDSEAVRLREHASWCRCKTPLYADEPTPELPIICNCGYAFPTRHEVDLIRACLKDGSYTHQEQKDFGLLCEMAYAHLARQPAAQSPVREGDVQMTDGLGNVTVYSYDHLGIPHKVGQPAAREPEGQWMPKKCTEAMRAVLVGASFTCLNCTKEEWDAVYARLLRASSPTEGESK